MLSSETISNLFDKIISTLLMDIICIRIYEHTHTPTHTDIYIYIYIYIYMILFQFKTVCLFPLDFSIQNVLCKYTYVMLEKSICKTCKMFFSPG